MQWLNYKAVFQFPVLTIFIIAIAHCYFVHQSLTKMILERRQAIAHFAGIALKERLDSVVEVGLSLASRVQFRALIQEGKWDEAVQILKKVTNDLPYISRIFLSDVQGTEMAAVPELSGAVGKNFAFRDWYKGVTHQWKPYISEVYKRAAEPRYNVTAVAVPIKTDDGSVLGILVLQVRLDTILEWNQSLHMDNSGFVYFTDAKGHLAAHPTIPLQGDIVDFSSVPAVRWALEGQRGVAVNYNPVENQERLAAYEPIPGYKWAVVFQEPTETAFAGRNRTLFYLSGIYAFIVFLNFLLASIVCRIFEVHQKNRQQLLENQKRLNSILENAKDAIVTADSDGNVIGWNQTAQTMFGYTSAEMLGKSLTLILPERFRGPQQQGFEWSLKKGDAHFVGKTFQLEGLKKNGEECTIELSLSSWKINEEVFFTGIIRDITFR